MQGAEVAPDEPLPDGVASPPPMGFMLVLWVGAFAAMTWGMMVLFGQRPGNRRTPEEP